MNKLCLLHIFIDVGNTKYHYSIDQHIISLSAYLDTSYNSDRIRHVTGCCGPYIDPHEECQNISQILQQHLQDVVRHTVLVDLQVVEQDEATGGHKENKHQKAITSTCADVHHEWHQNGEVVSGVNVELFADPFDQRLPINLILLRLGLDGFRL